MISDPQGTVLALFLVFCRIGGCVLTLPGFSSARVPEQLRVFIAGGLSLAVLPDTVPCSATGNCPIVASNARWASRSTAITVGELTPFSLTIRNR